MSEDSVCGPGSLFHNTEAVRAALIDWTGRYGIKTLVDAGAGDIFWIRSLFPEFTNQGLAYQAFDREALVPEVNQLDYTRELLPECDAILCRHSLNHNDFDGVIRALELFRRSTTILMATQFSEPQPAKAKAPGFTRFNLAIAPFNLGEPLELVKDAKDTSLALWRLT